MCPGQLVEPAGPRTRALVTQDIYRLRGHPDPGPSRRVSWSNPRDLRPWREFSGTAGRPRGSSDTGPRHLEQLIDIAGHWTWARIARDSWSTLRDLGHGP